MSRQNRVDTDFVRRQLALGQPLEAIAADLGRSVSGVKTALVRTQRNGDTLIEPEPEASLRQRWERLIPTLKANLIKEMLRDE